MTREEARKHLIDWVSYVENPNSIPDFDQPCSADEIIESMKIGAEVLSESKLPEDLEEAAEESWQNSPAKGIYDEYSPFYKDGFIAGAEWQKAKMMDDAEECDLYYDGDFLAIDVNMEALGYCERDKVRVIVIKEDEL